MLFVLLCVCLCGATLAAAPPVDAQRETARLAAQLLAAELRAALLQRRIQEERIYQTLLTATNMPVAPQASAAALTQLAQQQLQEWYTAEMQRILTALDGNRPEHIESWFDGDAQRALQEFPAAVALQNISNCIAPMAQTYRTRALTAQWNRLVTSVAPTPEEIEQHDTNAVENIMLERLVKAQKETLFDETKRALKEQVVRRVLNDARGQLLAQMNIVNTGELGGAITPAAIEAALRAALAAHCARLRQEKETAQSAAPVYDVFPSVAALLPRRAQERAAEKFARALGQMRLAADADALALVMQANLAAHVRAKDAWARCAAQLRPVFAQQVVANYARNAPASDYAALQTFLMAALVSNAACSSAMTDLVSRSAQTAFTTARQGICAAQFAQFFAPLSSGTWLPADDFVAGLTGTPARVQDPLACAGIASLAFDRNILFEETIARVTSAVNERIQPIARALAAQMNLVGAQEQELGIKLREARPLPEAQALATKLSDNVLAAWRREPDAARYAALFQTTRTAIAARAAALRATEMARRQWLDELARRAEVMIDLDENASTVSVTMLVRNQSQPLALRADARAGYQDAQQQLRAPVTACFTAWLRAAQKEPRDVPPLVVVRVANPAIKYVYVAALRDCLRAAMDAAQCDDFQIRWLDTAAPGATEKGTAVLTPALSRTARVINFFFPFVK